MKTLVKHFEAFAHMMDEAHVYRNPNVTFCDICRFLKVAPSDLEEIIYRETGYYGEEILRQYRKDEKNFYICPPQNH